MSIDLTESEWRVMECLWAHAPMTGRLLTTSLAETTGWNRSTTLTLLRRLEAKGAVACASGKTVLEYTPLITREDAVLAETENLLSRLYNGSVSLLVNAMTSKQRLSDAEIRELYALLALMEKSSEKQEGSDEHD